MLKFKYLPQQQQEQQSPNVDTLHTRMLMLHSQLDNMNIDLSSQTSNSSFVNMSPPLNNKSIPTFNSAAAAAAAAHFDDNVNDEEIDSLYESIRNQQIQSVYVHPNSNNSAELNDLRLENKQLITTLDELKTKLEDMESNTSVLQQQVNQYKSLFEQAHGDKEDKQHRIQVLEQQTNTLQSEVSAKELEIRELLAHKETEEEKLKTVDQSNPPTPSQVIAIERKFHDQLVQERHLFQYKLIEMERVMKAKEYKTKQLSNEIATQKAVIAVLKQQQRSDNPVDHHSLGGVKGITVELEAMRVHVNHLKSLLLKHVNGASVELVDTVTSLSQKLSYWMVLRDIYEETVHELIPYSDENENI